MTHSSTPKATRSKPPVRPTEGAQPPRHSPTLRHAIKIRVEQGKTILEACKIAGLSEAGWHKAMQRPAVRDLYEQTELQFIQTIERRRKGYKARAVEVAADIMERSQSDAARMRAVEFFAGEVRSGAQVNVNIGAASGGYEFLRPGQRIIDITPLDGLAPDSPSGDIDGQAVDITDE